MTQDQTPDTGAVINSLDDVPSVARLAARQEFLAKWYHPVALAPFAVVVFVAVKFFGDSTSVILDALVGASLAWAIAVAAYTFYLLFWGVKCPQCGWRFGTGVKCGSCNLPRRANNTFMA
jgi:hypothetical protein